MSPTGWSVTTVTSRKPEIVVESGKAPLEAFVPHRLARSLTHQVPQGELASQRSGLWIRCQAGMEFHVDADAVVFELLSLLPFHRETSSASDSA